MITRDDGPRSHLARELNPAGAGVQQPAAVARIDGLRVELVSNAEVERKRACDLPVVLEIADRHRYRAVATNQEVGCLAFSRKPHQEIRQRRARTGPIVEELKMDPKKLSATANHVIEILRASMPVLKA